MEDPTPIAPLPQKRPHTDDDDDVEPTVSTPPKQIRSEASTPLSVLSVQTPSPLRSSAPTSTAPNSSNVSAPTPSQPAKKRKLTSQEKEAQRLEKEAKAKAREEKKAQKEAEEKVKAEQKAQRDEEKRKKNEERDEKKRLKEEEQQRVEEEKAKKARSQMKLNTFFVKPKAGSSPGQAVVVSSQNPTASSTSLSSTSGAKTNLAPPSPQKNIVKNAQSDYERYFLPFNLPPHTILAPINTLLDDPERLEAARTRLENLIAHNSTGTEIITRETLVSSLPRQSQPAHRTATIAEVIERVNGSSDRPIDLTVHRSPLEMLREIPMKYIHFCKDVRPPYYGTYTRPYTDAEASRLARNPLARVRQDTDYDYDSEAEWDEPEEGEDLDSDGEDDNEEDAEDDLDGFLDDEEDPQLKRRLISGDLVPVSTGLCWEDAERVSRLNDGSDAICTDFRGFSMGFLLDPQMSSIDPFSTAYWEPDPATNASTVAVAKKDNPAKNAMNPPRVPLVQRSMNGLLNTLNGPQKSTGGTPTKLAKAKRLVPTEQLAAFKAEIEGKDLTKIGMIEALKKVFPKLPKDAISNTLSVVAARVGPTEKEKRWVLVNT
ncbi:chromatin assembly factor 1 subunit A-domain-containing protein [Alternaria rosae]|uniref:chromatin assembly factor 1 subunit A-domain-containing protein n=1 Tax=Alternaria rosae TaxID=1187941 RepID=UPI001E8DF5EC|nr:chromatin assembly factor 1 subunit A-domain-containing protein [Alternaria rosae]KAH6882341.1 chromatin assembly factor 1 subunit A-domain-containing protein [Alternaria rosae]